MKYILFDLDGTLTDPKIGITKSVKYALEKFDTTISDLKELEKFIGPPLTESFIKYFDFTPGKAETAVEYFREYFSDKGIFENKVYPGISNLLKNLNNADFTLAVATSKPTIFAKRILNRFGLSDYFNITVGSNLDGTRVEKFEVIQHVLNKLNTKKSNITMVGDRKYDIKGANRAGLHSIGVLYGYGSLEELNKANADFLVKTVSELEDVILSNN